MTEATKKGRVYYFNKNTVEGYWQPKPANGHVTVAVSPKLTPMERDISMGTQTLPPDGRVREHAHPSNEEILHFISGTGTAVVDGETYKLEPGVTLFLGNHNSHTFLNDGQEDLHWVWFMTPSGLEDFFKAIGRPRTEGEAAPEPFERPENIEQLESADNGVFTYTKD
jgi:quercetin dioxygenase-like cupin family protein